MATLVAGCPLRHPVFHGAPEGGSVPALHHQCYRFLTGPSVSRRHTSWCYQLSTEQLGGPFPRPGLDPWEARLFTSNSSQKCS